MKYIQGIKLFILIFVRLSQCTIQYALREWMKPNCAIQMLNIDFVGIVAVPMQKELKHIHAVRHFCTDLNGLFAA